LPHGRQSIVGRTGSVPVDDDGVDGVDDGVDGVVGAGATLTEVAVAHPARTTDTASTARVGTARCMEPESYDAAVSDLGAAVACSP
jgi:hypothetical protein